MIGIEAIGHFIPTTRLNTLDRIERFATTREFIEHKIGFQSLARMGEGERSSDLCVAAARDLQAQLGEGVLDGVDFVCVVTQNGDHQLPQTSAVVLAKLGLGGQCASFDLSLGCSGYVYGLSVARSFMEANDLKRGLLFTSDPYSRIVDPEDKNTALLFGDAAAVTLLSESPRFAIGKAVCETDGTSYEHLIKHKQAKLVMNGRGIYNFAMKRVPANIERCIEANGMESEAIDRFLLHQASKFIIDSLRGRLKLEPDRMPFVAQEYGNTISSSIPILLKDYLPKVEDRTLLLCGFGVGLSIASTVLRRL